MPNLHHISSLDLPNLQPYRTLRRAQEHRSQGIFVAEGEKVVRRLLASNLSVVSLLLTEEWFERLPPNGLEDRLCEVFLADEKLLETIVGFTMHQGIMAVAHVPPEPALDDVIRSSPSPQLFVALDGLVFAENVGIVVRNCAAFGVQGVLVGETSASPYLRRAVRNSMGTVFQIPVMHTQRLGETISSLRARNHILPVIADAHAEASLYDTDCNIDLCVVFGNENSGVSSSIKSIVTQTVRIPMKEGIDSLNVASASAVVLAEISRQRSRG